MKKLLLISLLTVSVLYGYSYNDLLIKAQSSIFPKIMLLDKKLEEKLVEGTVVYSIVYEEEDRQTAQKIRNLITENYGKYLGGYPLRVELVPSGKLDQHIRTTALYLLNTPTGISHAGEVIKEKGIMTFAYDIDNLQYGILLSLMVEKSTVLYLNRKGLQDHRVDFVEALYQIVRFTEN